MAMTLNSEEQTRVNNVYNEREKALAENNSMYEGLINNAGELRDQQNAYLAQQEQIQNQNLDLQLENQKQMIDKQKEEASQNKKVEENKALNTYLAYTNPYGSQAEALASKGLTGSGVNSYERLGALVSYQNRVATANANLQKAFDNYNLAYDQAVRERDVQKGQNALKKLELQLQANQDYMNTVSNYKQSQFSNAQSIRNTYMDQYNNVYNQILNEQKQAEAARQWAAEYQLEKKKLNSQTLQVNGGSGVNGSYTGVNTNYDDPRLAVEVYQYASPTLSGKDKNWYNNDFERHSYQAKDLLWVVDKAVDEGKLSPDGRDRILDSYSQNASSRYSWNGYGKN